MPVRPSENEEEYFVRQEALRLRKHAEEHRKQMAAAERESARALHHMKCPKCGMDLEEIAFGGVHVDKCFNCEGLWLDKGELERIETKEPGFAKKLLKAFRS